MWIDLSEYSRPITWSIILLAALLVLGGMIV